MTPANKAWSYAIIGFLLITFYLAIRPDKPISPELFDSSNIDSIQLYENGEKHLITDSIQIGKISFQLGRCKKIEIDKPNYNTGFINLYFFTKGDQDPIPLRILFNYYGKIITTDRGYYQNDSLYLVIKSFFRN